MRNNTKYSILVPAYKRTYLAECIASVLAQTIPDWELVVVDDASPEDLVSVVRLYDDPRIRYYRNAKNCGAVDVVDNWNICLGYAQGTYCICMGDDDRLLPESLANYDDLIAKHPGLAIYHAWTEIIDENGDVVGMQEPRPEREGPYSMIWNRWRGRMQFIGDFLYDVAQLRADGGFHKVPLAWGSDDITAVRAAAHAGIANMHAPGFQYRSSTITISAGGNIKQKMLALGDFEIWLKDFIASNDPTDEAEKVYRKLCKDGLRREMLKRKCYTVTTDITHNGLTAWLYWIWHHRKYSMGIASVCYSAVQALKTKILRRKK